MEKIILVKITKDNKGQEIREEKQYIKLDKIGSGAYGKVYKIKDLKTEEIKALKFLKDEQNFDKKIQIINIINTTNSPYIIRKLGSGKEIIKQDKTIKKKNFVVYEYASNGALENYLIYPNNAAIEEKYAKILFKKIVRGVKSMHDVNICHRDIKLNNILLDNHFVPKIADFGFAIYCINLKYPSGTKYYCAPEVLNKNYDGKKADIFSLGVTLLRIVTGKGPNSEKYYKSLDNLDEFIEENTIDISPQVKALIKKMVKTEPQERPDINQVLNDPWLNDFQEDNQLLLSEYEQEFIRRNKNIEETKDNKDNIININNKIDFQGDNKSISDNSEDDDYKKSFELKIIDEEDENIDLKDFLIIQGDISPKDYMNFIKRLLKIEFSEYINNEIKSKNKEGKFFFKGSKHYFKFKVGIEYDNEKNYKNDDDEFNDEKLFIKKRNLLIRGTLLKSTNGYYILRFYKKSGDIEEYYEKLNQMISILKEFI